MQILLSTMLFNVKQTFNHIDTTIISTNISKEANDFSELLSPQIIAVIPHNCTIAFKADH